MPSFVDSLFSLSGRVAIVTGGSRGIGAAIAGAPGYIRTAMTESGHADTVRHEQRKPLTMLDRWGSPSGLVGVPIVSGAPSYVAGINPFVDGDWVTKSDVEK